MTGHTDTKSLKAALKRLAAFHDSKPHLPILNYAHVNVHYGWAHLTVYDMERSLTVKVAIDGADPCSIAVRFKDFRKIIDKVKSDAVGMDFQTGTDEPKLTVSAGKLEFKLNARPGDDYPKLPEADMLHAVTDMAWGDFTHEAVFVKAASSMDTANSFTSGILFAYKPDTLEIVGTDGHRLHVSRIRGTHDIKTDADNHAALVPTATIHAMTRLNLDPGASVRIAFAENLMTWSVPDENIEGIAHLIDTPYPEYEKVIPDDCASRFRLDTDATIESLDALAIVATQRDGRDMIVVNANGTLNLSARSDAMGEASGVVACIHLDGPEAIFALNVHYFTETLKLAGTRDVLMSNSGSLEPVRFDYDGTDRIAVVMPVRLPE
jgi:DNA polymerase-3 subunit beta